MLLAGRRRAARALLQLLADGRDAGDEARAAVAAADGALADLRDRTGGPGAVWVLRHGGRDDSFASAHPQVALAQEEAWESRRGRLRHAVARADGRGAPAFPCAPPVAEKRHATGAAPPARVVGAGCAPAPAPACRAAAASAGASDDAALAAAQEWVRSALRARGVVNRALLEQHCRRDGPGQGGSAGCAAELCKEAVDAVAVKFGEAAVVLRELGNDPSAPADLGYLDRWRWAYIECFTEQRTWQRRHLERRVTAMVGGGRVSPAAHAKIVGELAFCMGPSGRQAWIARPGTDW